MKSKFQKPIVEESKEAIRTADHLMQIAEDIQGKLDEAKRIVREEGGQIAARARAYWIPHIEMALTNDHDWLGSCHSIQDTADEIRGFKME